jgi:S1-C subfamily serine protease
MRGSRTFGVLVVAWLVACFAGAVAWSQVLPREVRVRLLEAVIEVAPYDVAAGRFTGTGGSGTIISPDGYVLTNFHVIGEIETGESYEWHAIYVTDPTTPDRQTEHRYWARYVAGDAQHDLAVLKIELLADESPLPAGLTFVAATLGDSNTLIPGDPITVIGYPGIGGFTVTVTTGIVSGWLGEDLESGGKQWIKTDARIAGGNSGGGAFDDGGRLVAIPTSRVQTMQGAFEEQNLLRPVALALPLIAAHVPTAERVGGGVASLGGAPAPSTPLSAPTVDARGTTVRGTLADGDPALDSGEFLDIHEWTLQAGVTVELVLRSDEFDPYLGLLGPDGALVLEVDDSAGEGFDVRERFVPERSGTYRVVVTSAFPGETGSYELLLAQVAAAPGPPVTAPSQPTPRADPFADAPVVATTTAARALDPTAGTVGALPLGARVPGRLSGSSDTTYHTYVIDVPQGTRSVSFVLRADADLDLFVKHGSDIANWADGGDWLLRDIDAASSAVLTVTDPAAGRWYVDVVFYQGGATIASYSFEVR